MDKQRYDIMIGMQAGELAKGVQSAKGNLKDLRQAFKDTLDVLNTAPPAQIGVTKQLEAARKKVAQLAAEIKKLEASGKTVLSSKIARTGVATPKQKAAISAGAMEAQALIKAAQPSVIEANKIKEQQKALSQMQNKSITLRYALYDVGSAAQSASRALLGFSGAAINAAAAQQAAFSQIEKTLVGQASVQQLDKLRRELVDLSTQIPVSFEELTKIGMLGSQLGIAADDIAKFTEVTSKFSAITGMSVEETAMGFGKIANILGLSANQYQALGSAIAAVGVKTAATEQQIISTAGQIGAVAKAAGFSASEVIGLSAAFASLRIAPEESRGVIVRTFNEIDRAVLSFSKNSQIGGERLKVLANIAKISSQDFAEGWGDKTSGGASRVFKQFVDGLRSTNISQELKRIGLDGVRTSKGLTALANGFDLVVESMNISREAGMAGTFLDESFATIVEDLSSKLKMLENSFQNLLAAGAGGTFLDLLGAIAGAITGLNNALTDLIENGGVAGAFAKFAIIVTGIVGLLAALAGTLAIAGGGFLALRTAYLAAAADGLLFKGGIMGLITSLLQMLGILPATSAGITGVGTAARGAALGVGALTTSMKLARLAFIGTGIGVVVLLLGELASMFANVADASDAPVTGLDKIQTATKKLREETNATTQELVDFINQALLPISNMVKVENALYSLGQALRDNANDFNQYSKAGRANITALMSTIEALTISAQGNQQQLANSLTALMNYMIQSGLGAAEAFKIIEAAIRETGKVAEEVLLPFTSLDAGLKEVGTSASGSAREVDKLAEAFKGLDASIKLEESLDAFGESLGKNGKDMRKFSSDGRANLKALRDVIFSLRDRLANKPQSLANTFASLRQAMMQMGITSKTAFRMVDIAIESTGKKGKALRKVVDGLVQSLNQSAADSQPLRTLTDYVNDLSGVLDDALNNRYAKQDSSDSITSAWISIKEAAEDAKKAIDDANASINEMQADRNVLQYQLQVAIRYGDTLRAESIKAKLAKLDADLVEKRQDLADAQAEANKTLIGNTKYAIANRAVVRDLVTQYNAYLTSLAQSGMSTEDLKTEAAKLADEFVAQGVQMGFAKDELLSYTDAFKKDFTTVVNNVPKDITLNVVTDPALQAVVDFVKSTNAELAKILSGTIDTGIPGAAITLPGAGRTTSGTSGTGTSTPTPTTTSTPSNTRQNALDLVDKRQKQVDDARAAVDKQNALIESTKKTIANLQRDLNFASSQNKAAIQTKISNVTKLLSSQQAQARPLQQALSAAMQALASAKASVPKAAVITPSPLKLRDGGLVRGPGFGTSDSINAMLSNGEYVLRANAVKYYGADFMNSLNQMQVQRPGAATGSNVVYLSPDDRALLRAAIDRPISLYTENTRIAESANAGNVVLAQRGMK